MKREEQEGRMRKAKVLLKQVPSVDLLRCPSLSASRSLSLFSPFIRYLPKPIDSSVGRGESLASRVSFLFSFIQEKKKRLRIISSLRHAIFRRGAWTILAWFHSMNIARKKDELTSEEKDLSSNVGKQEEERKEQKR